VKRNITLKLDDELLKRVRHLAIDEDKSVSAWVSDLILQTVSRQDAYEQARNEALDVLKRGLALGGTPLTREQAHERN
jgi:predicted transcriptional regulator